jgi:hypothetical protein
MQLRKSVPALVVILFMIPASSPGDALPDEPPCALGRLFKQSQHLMQPKGYTPCAAFDVTSPDVMTLSESSFNGNEPHSVLALDDGSVVVDAGEQLFRVDRDNRITNLWGALPGDQLGSGRLYLIAPYRKGFLLVRSHSSSWLMGVRPDGSVAFNMPGIYPKNAVQDTLGFLWIYHFGDPKSTIYAMAPNEGGVSSIQKTSGDWNGLFADSHGSIYASLGYNGDLYKLDLQNGAVETRFAHASIAAIPQLTGQVGSDYSPGQVAVQAIGPDGSLWASTLTQVIHIHADGTSVVMRLREPFFQMMHPIPDIPLKMAPDGSVWIQTWHEFVRITNNDRVQAIHAPARADGNDYTVDFSFAPDSSMWYVQMLRPDKYYVVHIKVRD